MIVSRQNRKLKTMRRLRRCKGDHALLEGPHLIHEALRAGLRLEEVLATPEFLARAAGKSLAAILPEPPLLVAAPLLDELADADSPRGVLAIARLPRGGCETLPTDATNVIVLAAGLQDPGNLGALGRAIEAAGGRALALTKGSVHPNHPRALRASAGSLLRLRVAVEVNLAKLCHHRRRQSPRVVAMTPRGGEDLYSADLSGSLILVIGAEGPGLSGEIVSRADLRVTIPLSAPVESLNTAVAAALALFEIRRRRPSARA